jgi:hypothetical protein
MQHVTAGMVADLIRINEVLLSLFCFFRGFYSAGACQSGWPGKTLQPWKH